MRGDDINGAGTADWIDIAAKRDFPSDEENNSCQQADTGSEGSVNAVRSHSSVPRLLGACVATYRRGVDTTGLAACLRYSVRRQSSNLRLHE